MLFLFASVSYYSNNSKRSYKANFILSFIILLFTTRISRKYPNLSQGKWLKNKQTKKQFPQLWGCGFKPNYTILWKRYEYFLQQLKDSRTSTNRHLLCLDMGQGPATYKHNIFNLQQAETSPKQIFVSGVKGDCSWRV